MMMVSIVDLSFNHPDGIRTPLFLNSTNSRVLKATSPNLIACLRDF